MPPRDSSSQPVGGTVTVRDVVSFHWRLWAPISRTGWGNAPRGSATASEVPVTARVAAGAAPAVRRAQSVDSPACSTSRATTTADAPSAPSPVPVRVMGWSWEALAMRSRRVLGVEPSLSTRLPPEKAARRGMSVRPRWLTMSRNCSREPVSSSVSPVKDSCW